MSYLKKEPDYLCSVAGDVSAYHIRSIVAEAVALSDKEKCIVRFDFKGVTVRVEANSDLDLICHEWFRVFDNGHANQVVGPHPKMVSGESEKIVKSAEDNKTDPEPAYSEFGSFDE